MGQFVTTVTKFPLMGQPCYLFMPKPNISNSCGQIIHSKYHTVMLNIVLYITPDCKAYNGILPQHQKFNLGA